MKKTKHTPIIPDDDSLLKHVVTLESDIFHIYDVVGSLDFLIKNRSFERLPLYLPDLKRAIKEFKKHIYYIETSE